MSSSASNSSFIDATAASMRETSRLRSAGFFSVCNWATKRLRAWSGWRRSWLAEARKWGIGSIGHLPAAGSSRSASARCNLAEGKCGDPIGTVTITMTVTTKNTSNVVEFSRPCIVWDHDLQYDNVHHSQNYQELLREGCALCLQTNTSAAASK